MLRNALRAAVECGRPHVSDPQILLPLARRLRRFVDCKHVFVFRAAKSLLGPPN
jgi:hypothetical protein